MSKPGVHPTGHCLFVSSVDFTFSCNSLLLSKTTLVGGSGFWSCCTGSRQQINSPWSWPLTSSINQVHVTDNRQHLLQQSITGLGPGVNKHQLDRCQRTGCWISAKMSLKSEYHHDYQTLIPYMHRTAHNCKLAVQRNYLHGQLNPWRPAERPDIKVRSSKVKVSSCTDLLQTTASKWFKTASFIVISWCCDQKAPCCFSHLPPPASHQQRVSCSQPEKHTNN